MDVCLYVGSHEDAVGGWGWGAGLQRLQKGSGALVLSKLVYKPSEYSERTAKMIFDDLATD